jgi:hypothetical protein
VAFLQSSAPENATVNRDWFLFNQTTAEQDHGANICDAFSNLRLIFDLQQQRPRTLI